MVKNISVLSKRPKKLPRPRALYRFAALMASGMDATQAGEQVESDISADEFMNHPEFSQALVVAFHHELSTQHAPQALKRLSALVQSRDESVAFRAVKLILDKAAPDVRRDDQSPDDKDIESLSTSQLADLVGKLEGELSDRAKPVNAPAKPDIEQQVTDIMG